MSVNKVIIIGHVGQDPDIREHGDVKYSNFSVATTEKGFTTKNGIEVPDRTEWHKVVTAGGLSKLVEEYVHKGTLLYAEGKLSTRSYETRDGHKKFVTEIHANKIDLLGSNNKPQANTPPPKPESIPNPTPTTSSEGDETDDLPF